MLVLVGEGGVLVDLAPLASSLLPDEDSPVVAAGGEDISKPGVSPSHLPHRTLVTLQVSGQRLLTVADIEYLDGPGEDLIDREEIQSPLQSHLSLEQVASLVP